MTKKLLFMNNDRAIRKIDIEGRYLSPHRMVVPLFSPPIASTQTNQSST